MTDTINSPFNVAYQSYIDKFGTIPMGGIGYPKITTELLAAAVESGIEITEYELPVGADS
jgi:hypothetical protein